MKNLFKGLLVAGLSALTLTACGGETVTNDKLVIGMECNYQPFNWTAFEESEHTLPIFGANGEYADGYDVAVAKYLSEATGKEVEIHRMVWDNLIPSLNAGTINMVLAGMTDTPERRQSIDFTDPYLSSDLAFLIKTTDLEANFPDNSASNPATYEELLTAFSGEVLVCQANVVGDGFIDTYFSSVDSSIHHNTATTSYPLAAQQVASGVAFAMPAELPVVEAMTNINDNLSVLYVDDSFLQGEDQNGMKVSIGVKKGNQELIDLLNDALAKLSDEQRQQMMGDAATRSAE